MRTIKCDKCGYEHIFTSEDDTFDGIRRKNIYIIVGSEHASDEPIQRVEHYKHNIDLCLNCQKELQQMYDEASDVALAVIDKWLDPEDAFEI